MSTQSMPLKLAFSLFWHFDKLYHQPMFSDSRKNGVSNKITNIVDDFFHPILPISTQTLNQLQSPTEYSFYSQPYLNYFNLSQQKMIYINKTQWKASIMLQVTMLHPRKKKIQNSLMRMKKKMVELVVSFYVSNNKDSDRSDLYIELLFLR